MAPRLASPRKCTGCMACVDSCNNHAINHCIDKDGHYSISFDESLCVGCLLCEKSCPVASGFSYCQSDISEYYSAWNKNDEERINSASGGVFSAMAHYIIDNGGCVIGAATDDVFNVKHIVIDTLSDLARLQGSKYSQSDMSGIYKKTLELLRQGRLILFSGTGCQVAALLSFLGRKYYKGRLITVDLICGGVPSKYLLTKFVEHEPYQMKRILSYRTKDNGWKPTGFEYNMKVEDVDGNVHDYAGVPNLVTTAFSQELTERYSCYNCQFVGEKRMSDFTIGDLWGDTMNPQQHYMGLSLIVAHKPEALDLLEKMGDYLCLSSCDADAAKKTNFRLVRGKNSRQYTLERLMLHTLFENFSYKTLLKIYADNVASYSPWIIWRFCRKVYVKVINQLI